MIENNLITYLEWKRKLVDRSFAYVLTAKMFTAKAEIVPDVQHLSAVSEIIPWGDKCDIEETIKDSIREASDIFGIEVSSRIILYPKVYDGSYAVEYRKAVESGKIDDVLKAITKKLGEARREILSCISDEAVNNDVLALIFLPYINKAGMTKMLEIEVLVRKEDGKYVITPTADGIYTLLKTKTFTLNTVGAHLVSVSATTLDLAVILFLNQIRSIVDKAMQIKSDDIFDTTAFALDFDPDRKPAFLPNETPTVMPNGFLVTPFWEEGNLFGYVNRHYPERWGERIPYYKFYSIVSELNKEIFGDSYLTGVIEIKDLKEAEEISEKIKKFFEELNKQVAKEVK